MTLKTSSRLAGIMFLFYIATGIAGLIVFSPASKGAGTAAKLASIAAHESLVRWETAYAFVMILNPIILGIALYALTRDTDPEIALMALLFRTGEGFVVAINAVLKRALLVIAALPLSDSLFPTAVLGASGVTALFGATLFAIGSTLFSWLFVRSRTIPPWLAWLGVASSLLLVACLPLQMGGTLKGMITNLIWVPAGIFELTIAVRLLTRPICVGQAPSPVPQRQ